MEHFRDRGSLAAPSGRAPWGRIGLVVAVGVAGFAITAGGRSGGTDGAAPPTPTSTVAATPTTALAEPVRPLVVEVPMRILAPIELIGLPEDDESYEGAALQTSVVDILSPVVGEAMVPSGGGSAADSWAPAPPEFAAQLGLAVPDPDLATAAERDPESAPDPVEIPDGALDVVIRAAAEDRAREIELDDAPLLGEPIFLADGDVGFVDPCAEAESDRCPDPGEPATVTRFFAQTVPPPFAVIVTANPTDECAADVADDELRVAIESTTPIEELRLQYWRQVRSSVTPVVDLATPEDAAAAWLEAFEAAAIDGPPPPPIMHCLTLTDITTRDGRGYRYKIEALDVFDQEWRTEGHDETQPYLSTALQIPQTLVWTLTDNEVLVSAAHRADQAIRIYAFKRTGDGDAPDPCRSADPAQPGYAPAWSPLETTRSTTALDRLVAAGLDPNYLHRTAGAMRLDEGSTYRLCVYWSVRQPTFDAGVERTEGYDLTTPDALETSFTVVDIDIDGTDRADLDSGDLGVIILPKSRALVAGFPACGSWLNETPIDSSVAIDGLICDVHPRSTALYERGAIVEIRARDIEGDNHTSRHIIRTLSCTGLCVPPESQFFRLELPTGAPERDFWCGGIFDACDRPSDQSYGTVLIRVDYANDTGNFSAGWSVSEPTEIGDERPDQPETPQLDTSQTPLASGPGRAQTVTVPIVADRPVSVEVELRSTSGDAPCVSDGRNTTYSAPDQFNTQHTITFEGLCPVQRLLVIVTLTDTGGNSSVWHSAIGSPDFPADAQLWRRAFVPIRPIRWEFNTDLEVTVPTSHYRIRGLGVSLDGSTRTGGVWASRAPDRQCYLSVLPLTTSAYGSDGESPRVGSTDNRVEFTIVVDIELLIIQEERCTPLGDSEQPGPQAVQLIVPADDVVVGESYSVVGSIPIAGLSDPDATLDVTGTITIVSEA